MAQSIESDEQKRVSSVAGPIHVMYSALPWKARIH